MMVVFMVLVFLMSMVTINIGKVALWKTATANAADSAALAVATNLGSQARAMCAQIRNTPNPGLCKGCVFGGYFGIIIGVILIIVGIVLICTVWLAWGGVALIILGIAYIVQTAVFDTYSISKLNNRFDNLPPKTALKLQAHLIALTSIADDPNTVKDERDIDGDGDREEEIAAFADWFEQKFAAIEQEVTDKNREAADEFSAKLEQTKTDMQDLITVLQNEIIPVFQWIETEYDGRPHTVLAPDGVTLTQVFRPKIDLPFWRPGDQGSQMCLPDGSPCGALCNDHLREDETTEMPEEPAGPDLGDDEDEDPTVLDVPLGIWPCDEVDFVAMEAKDFLTFADGILAMTPDERALTAGKWVEGFRDFGAASFTEWSWNLQNWQKYLNETVKPQLIWPAPAEWNVLPPPSPPVPVGQNPVDWVVNRIKGKFQMLKDLIKQLEKIAFDPVDVPVDPLNMIYSWQDNRGCHHIGAEVYRQKAGGKRTDLRIPKFKSIRKFAKTCTYVKRMTGEIAVIVKRYDQNQQTSPYFTMSHAEPLAASLDPCVCAGEGHVCTPDMQEQGLNAGIRSTGVARYSFKSSHGIRIKIAE